MSKKTIWAMDLGAWSLKVARGRREKSGRVEIDLYDEIHYPPRKAGEKGGFISRSEGAIQEFGKRFTLASTDELCVCIGGNYGFSRFITLPPVPDSVDEIIQYEARQQIPFDIDRVVWDYQPVKDEHEPWEEIKVGLFAFKSETIDELLELLRPWQKNLSLIQQAPLAALNFLNYEGYGSEPAAIIDMGAKATDVIVMDPPGFWLRSLRVGGDSMTDQIGSHLGISYREAERIKARASESGKEAKLARIVGKPVSNIVSEIQRSLGYYKSLAPDVKIKKIIAIGNAFRLKGMDRILADGLQGEVQLLTETRNADLTEDVREAVGGNLFGCCALFGLIVQGSGEAKVRINLVPERLAFESEMRRKRPLIVGAVAGVVVAFALMVMGEMMYGRRLEGAAGRMEAGLARDVQAKSSEYEDVMRDVQELERELRRLSDRVVRRDYSLHLLPEMTRSIPQGAQPAPDAMLPESVYISDLQLLWMTEEDYDGYIESIKEKEKPEEEVRSRRRDDPSPDYDFDDWDDYGYDYYETPTRDTRRAPREDRDMLPIARLEHMAGDESELVLEAVLESSVIRRAGSFIERTLQSWKDARYADTGEAVFSDIHTVGVPVSVMRDAETGEITTDEDGALEFVQFRVVARLNSPKVKGDPEDSVD